MEGPIQYASSKNRIESRNCVLLGNYSYIILEIPDNHLKSICLLSIKFVY